MSTSHHGARNGPWSLIYRDIFQETKRPSKEMQVTIARQLGLEPTTVGNFFMNARRRSMDKWKDESETKPGSSGSPSDSAQQDLLWHNSYPIQHLVFLWAYKCSEGSAILLAFSLVSQYHLHSSYRIVVHQIRPFFGITRTSYSPPLPNTLKMEFAIHAELGSFVICFGVISHFWHRDRR